jgi:hypothetical protein
LDINGYQIGGDTLSIELNSHPDFPSLKAYTDTLNNLEIENLTVTIPKDQFKKLTNPVLVSLNSNGKADIALAQLTDICKIRLNENFLFIRMYLAPFVFFM